jgi:glycosyltransferase involved in cell wall biosynthesis
LKFFREHQNEYANKKVNKIVYAGRLTEGKRVSILLDAFGLVHQQIPNLELDIIGDGSKMAELQKKSNDLGIAKKVKFLGPVYDDWSMAKKMFGASLMVMPGLGGLGLNTGMALGLPIIYTDADGTEKDLLKDE